MYNKEYACNTRLSTRGDIKVSGKPPRTEQALKSFKHRSAKEFNMLPETIRNSQNIGTFKTTVKKWIVENIEI